MISRQAILIFSAMVLLTPLVGCGNSGSTEPCSMCRGSGQAYNGRACSFCQGRGYRTLSTSEVDSRKHAETNLTRRKNGQAPLSDAEWWWQGPTGRYVALMIIFGIGGMIAKKLNRSQS